MLMHIDHGDDDRTLDLDGSRRILVAILRRALEDSCLELDPKQSADALADCIDDKQDALNWFQASSIHGNIRETGATFEFVISALGLSDQLENIRRRCLECPGEVLEGLDRLTAKRERNYTPGAIPGRPKKGVVAKGVKQANTEYRDGISQLVNQIYSLFKQDDQFHRDRPTA